MVYAAWVVTVFNALVVAYYWCLLLSATPRLGRRNHRAASSAHRFAIVIPCHNEESTILEVLDSCRALEYPEDQYCVFVVADNCSDRTAELASRRGAVCLERRDDRRKGKGYALSWAFERILPQGFDALAVLDADCRIEPHALSAFDRALSDGAMVMQARYAVSNPDSSSISYAVAVGNVIENDLFYAPKSRRGLAVLLRGTGMVFHHRILEEHPWTATSNTEDVEYALDLIAADVPIRFMPEVAVWSDFPEDSRQLLIQRRRWASGTANVGKTRGLRMILAGLFRLNLAIIDAGWTLLVLSRPLVILAATSGCVLAYFAASLGVGAASTPLPWVALALLMSLVAYFSAGVLRLGLTRHRAVLLLSVPWVTAQLTWATLVGAVGLDRGVWNRTPRAAELARDDRNLAT